MVRRIATPARPRVVVFSADGKRGYVSSENGAAVTVVDALRNVALGRIAIPSTGVIGPLGARPMGLRLSPDGKRLYVANGRGGTVSIADTAARRVIATIASADARTLYTANGPSNDVSIIDLATRRVTAASPPAAAPGASPSATDARSPRTSAPTFHASFHGEEGRKEDQRRT